MNRQKRVAGCEQQRADGFDYSVQVLRLNTHNQYALKCSGTLILSQWVLTAAQCIHGMKKLEQAKISLESQRNRGPQYEVVWYDFHGEYNYRNNANDIALIKVGEKSIVVEYVKVIS